MLPHTDLYQAILARRSVRRYETESLDEASLAQVQEIISHVKPLVSGNQFEVLMRDVGAGENLVEDLGGYGRIVNPPHYLVPHTLGEAHLLEDLGYRVQQIAVRLTALGIGSCYIGALRREHEVRARFGLPDDARIAAFLIFGKPSRTLGGRTFNKMISAVSGASTKLSADRVFFAGTFDSPASPPADIAPLIEAARHAPSAVNAQPWRFLWRDRRLYLFVTRGTRRYGGGPQERYCFHDGGIAMANITLALEGPGKQVEWTMLGRTEAHIPSHPPDLHPMASLLVEQKS